MDWDKTLTRIAQEVADETEIRVDDLKFAVETFFKRMRQLLDESRGTAYILIRNLGRFFIPRKTVNEKILRTIRKYRAGRLGEKEFKRRMAEFLDLRRRINEERPSVGKAYKVRQEWKRKNLEENESSKENKESSTSEESE